MIMYDLHQWDIWEADVPYTEDKSKSSIRPVLIISDMEVLVLKMTSHHQSDKPKPYEYEMMRWEEAGLKMKTFIRCDKFIRLSERVSRGDITGNCSLRILLV